MHLALERNVMRSLMRSLTRHLSLFASRWC